MVKRFLLFLEIIIGSILQHSLWYNYYMYVMKKEPLGKNNLWEWPHTDGTKGQAPVVQTLDSAIKRINHYPADSVIGFPNTCPLDSELSGG